MLSRKASTRLPRKCSSAVANPAITAPIIGASKPEQLDASLAAAEYVLPDDLKQQLDERTAQYRMGDDPR